MNREIVTLLEEVARKIHAEYLLSCLAAGGDYESDKAVTSNYYRHRKMKAAIKRIERFPDQIISIDQLEGVADIGEGTIARVQEILETGRLDELAECNTRMYKKVKPIIELLTVIGVGPAVAKKLVVEHKITSIDQLRKAVQKDQVKVSHMVHVGLQYHDILETTLKRKYIEQVERYLRGVFQEYHPDLELEICGSYRRGKPTSSDIDVLIWYKSDAAEKKGLTAGGPVAAVVETLGPKLGYVLDSMTNQTPKEKYMGIASFPVPDSALDVASVHRLDIVFTKRASLGAALVYFTGPERLNVIMRTDAKKQGMTLNQHGLIKHQGGKEIPIVVGTEMDVFQKIKMDYLTPKQRQKLAD